jgi:hypothetical protein
MNTYYVLPYYYFQLEHKPKTVHWKAKSPQKQPMESKVVDGGEIFIKSELGNREFKTEK